MPQGQQDQPRGVAQRVARAALKLLSSVDPNLEVHLAAYAYGVLVASGILVYWALKGNRDVNFVWAFGAFLTAVTGGLLKRGSAAPPLPDPPDPGARP